jgi:hypothetical protein
VLDTGFLYFDTFTPKTGAWRWYDDETHETPTTPLAGENSAPASVAAQDSIKLRISVAESAGVRGDNVKFRLQYATSSDFSTGAYAVVEQGACTGTSGWCYADGAGVDTVRITTKTLSDADACTASVGAGCGTHNESGTSVSIFSHPPGAVAEYEFTITPSGATINTVYFFRLFDVSANTNVPLNTGATLPSLMMEGATLTFTIVGMPSGTSTASVTTDTATTPTGVPFGALPLSLSKIAAHRLTVSTNASQGYRIFVYQRQGLLGTGSDEIAPVSGTNTAPASWMTACNLSAAGCFGYHSSEAVLGGGSGRFAADDTYAGFSSTPDEIAYSATPTSGKSTDIVYRVEARGGQQAGDYNTELVYIVTPVF